MAVVYYDQAHGAVTFGLFAWLWWRRAELLPPLRAALIACNLLALAVFWTWPVAPPRMLPQPQFLDLVALVGGQSPHWDPGAISLYANQLSALPSLHVAWAVWSALVVWRLTRRRVLRGLAIVYPVVTTLAVMATGNHYLADAVTGAVLGVVTVLTADRLWARSPGGRDRWSDEHAVAGSAQGR